VTDFLGFLFAGSPGYIAVNYLHGINLPREQQLMESHYYSTDERHLILGDAQRAVDDARANGRTLDVYICPHPRASRQRRERGALGLRRLHIDLDNPPADPELWDKLGAFTVRSGGKGRVHGYVALDREVSLDEFENLEVGLRDALGGDSKIKDNDLLRLPGTWNFKPGVHCEVTVESATGTVWDPDDLAWQLGVDLNAPSKTTQRVSEIAPEDPPNELPSDVRTAWENQTVDDRSGAIYRLVAECRRYRFTLGQTIGLVRLYPPALDKHGHDADRIDTDVIRSWDKVEDPDRDTIDLSGHYHTPQPDEPGVDPSRFFNRDGLKVQTLTAAVDDFGALATDHAGTIYRYTDGAWFGDGERVVNQRVQYLLGNRHRKSHGANVLDIIGSRDPLFTEDQLDTEHLNLPNGLLHWCTGDLKPHNPRVPNLTRIPVRWNPDATCPEIDKWLGEVFPSDTVAFVEEVIGYTLLNDNPLHKAVMLFGTGSNGKGIFIRLLEALIGRGNCSSVRPQKLDESNFHAAELYGKLANLVGDVDPRIFKATEVFKQVTGGDTVTAERKYRDPFKFRCRATLIASFNEMPRTADTSEGFFRRWIVVPFLAYFSDDAADKGLFDRLSTPNELEGLLVRAVAGLQRLMARGHFQEPGCVQQATADFRVAADPVRSFLDERIIPSPEGFVHTGDLYSRFKLWCEENGHRPMGNKKFLGRVEAVSAEVLGFPLARVTRNGRGAYPGITVTSLGWP
jgi:P4 family phage/plasmid primase-like protien